MSTATGNARPSNMADRYPKALPCLYAPVTTPLLNLDKTDWFDEHECGLGYLDWVYEGSLYKYAGEILWKFKLMTGSGGAQSLNEAVDAKAQS